MATSSGGVAVLSNPIDPLEKRVSQSLMQRALRRFLRDRLTLLAAGILLVLVTLSVFAPFITDVVMQIDPNDTQYEALLPLGTPNHLFGTDDLGRDQMARLLHAGRISLGIGVFGALATLTIGLVIGMSMGYFGGAYDDFMNWVITTLD